MRPFLVFLFSIILLGSTLTVLQDYSTAYKRTSQDIFPVYNISTTLLHWNGTGYLPVVTPGNSTILGTVGYNALVTNVTVLSETSNNCTVRVKYIVKKAFGVNVPINKMLSRTFVVDTKTNSFIQNGTTVFFPFYVCSDSLKYTYHFNERINVNKTADFVVWRNVSHGGKAVTLEFGPVYSAVGKDLMGYLCSAVDPLERRCVKFEPYPAPSLDVDFSSRYIVEVYGTYPGDPLGILKGPVEFVGGIIKSERTAKLIGARPEDKGVNFRYITAGIIVLTVAGVLVRRVK